jgi:hypothetical protein
VKLAIRDNPLDAASHFLLGGLLEAVLFILTGLDQENVGFNFLKRVNANFNCFDSGNKIAGTGYAAPPALTGLVAGFSLSGWIFSAAASYGELVYKVAGNISGDIKPYPFGTTLNVTPTLLRTPAEDGTPHCSSGWSGTRPAAFGSKRTTERNTLCPDLLSCRTRNLHYDTGGPIKGGGQWRRTPKRDSPGSVFRMK